MTSRRRNSVAVLVLTGLCAVAHGATTLDLNFVGPDARPVHVAKAELLLVAWGETRRIELDTSTAALRVVLDRDWLRSRWDWFDDQEGVYLYLQAPPLAAIQSDRFKWLGVEDAGSVTIAFPRGQEVVVEEGTKASTTLAFRSRTARRVRIVDPDGRPRPGGRNRRPYVLVAIQPLCGLGRRRTPGFVCRGRRWLDRGSRRRLRIRAGTRASTRARSRFRGQRPL